jgi:hypothetical protein
MVRETMRNTPEQDPKPALNEEGQSNGIGLLLLSTFVISLCIAGCASIETPVAKSTTGRAPTAAEVPGNDETVRGDTDPPIVTLSVGSALREKKLSRSEELPGGIVIPTTNLKGVPVTAALEAVLSGTDISLSWDSKNWDKHLVTVTNLSGPLPQVVEKICGAARVFCSYRHGMLELKDKETFIVDLPAMPGKASSSGSGSSGGSSSSSVANSMSEAIANLAGEKTTVDQQGGNLIYSTDVEGQEMIHEYLEQLRNGRPLIVLQMYIWEVTLDKENASGINWSNMKLPTWGGNFENLTLAGNSAFSTISTGGMSLGATMAGKLTATSTLQFLSTQGSVQNISSPQMTFISGSDAEFRVGGKQYYISQVGLSNSVSGTTTNSTSTSVSTDSIETGLTMSVNGSYEGGVITANLDVKMQSLVKIDSVTTSDTKIQLPVTTDRKMSTSVRVRPGDNIILAGIVGSKDSNNKEGVPLPFNLTAQTYHDDSLENTEMVIFLKPSIILFSDKGGPNERPPAGNGLKPYQPHIDTGKLDRRDDAPQAAARPMPDAVMIDKDGSRSIAMPAQSASAVSYAPQNRGPIVSTPLYSTDAPAGTMPVDQNLLQSGFGQAYDQPLAGGGGL